MCVSPGQGATAGLPKQRNRAPISVGRDCVDTISAAVQPRAGCVFLDLSMDVSTCIVNTM